MKDNATVFIVDDDGPVRVSLERLLRSAGYTCSLFSNGQDLLRIMPCPGPGCIILDLKMEELSGLQVQKKLHEIGSSIPIIFLSGYGSVHSTATAMKNGAMDFLTKPVEDTILFEVVATAIKNHMKTLQQQMEIEKVKLDYATLTEREKDVMTCVISGAKNKSIATELGIAEKTVKIHRGRVMQKMKVESVVALYQKDVLLGVNPKD